MPKTLEQINTDIAYIESLNKQEPAPVEEMLGVISNALTDIKTISIMLAQIEYLSGKRIALLSHNYSAIIGIFKILRPIIAPYHKSKEHRAVMMQIATNLPSEEEEAEYITTLAFPSDKVAPTISRRIYIPQAFVGMVNVLEIQDIISEVAFLATAGLGPCVGYILFSKTAKCCALAHFDDLLNATIEEATEECKARAVQHYQVCAQRILDGISRFSDASTKAPDWQVILTPSQDPSSRMLTELLQLAVARIENITATRVNLNTKDDVRNILIELDGFLTEPAQLKLRSYQEVVQFADLPADLLTLQETLNLPTRGFSLYHIEEGSLTLQDINGLFTMVDNFVTPRPHAARVAVIADRVVAEPPLDGASAAAAAAAGGVGLARAEEVAAEPQLLEAVRRPVLMSATLQPNKKGRHSDGRSESDADVRAVEAPLADSSGAAQDEFDGEPPHKTSNT